MPSTNGDKAKSIADILGDLGEEVEREKLASLTNADRVMDELAKELLRLERDMTIPGNLMPDATRVERLTRFIEDKNF